MSADFLKCQADEIGQFLGEAVASTNHIKRVKQRTQKQIARYFPNNIHIVGHCETILTGILDQLKHYRHKYVSNYLHIMTKKYKEGRYELELTGCFGEFNIEDLSMKQRRFIIKNDHNRYIPPKVIVEARRNLKFTLEAAQYSW